MTTDLAIARRVMDAWQRAKRHHAWRPDCCVLATRVGIEVLKELGVTADAYPCTVVMFNAEAWRLYCANVPIARWPENAHSIGCGFTGHVVGKYDGHLMTAVGVHLVDLSNEQFHRPGKLHAPEPWIIERNGEGEGAIFRDERGQVIIVRPIKDKSYRQAPDWRRNWRELVPLVLAEVRDA